MEKKKVCSMLMRVGPRFPGLLDDSEGSERFATAQYQCLKTVNAVGPDFNTVTPEECTAERGCFKGTL